MRKLRSSIVAAFAAARSLMPLLWGTWGVGAVLSLATLAWLLWPSDERPQMPDRLESAAELKRELPKAPAAAHAPPETPAAGTEPPAVELVAPGPPSSDEAPARSEQEVFRETFFEPGAEGLDPRYSHEVELTPEQVKEVIERIDVLEQSGNEFDRMQRIYGELDLWLTEAHVEEAFFNRMKSGEGFKFPDLPELWARYSDKGGPDLDIPAYVQQGYYRLRIRNIKSAIIRGRATEGDLKFLEHAIQYVAQITIRMGFRLQNARKLEGYLKAEGMIGKNPAVVARERARSEAFHSRMEETLGQWGEEMLNGDPGSREQRRREEEERNSYERLEQIRRDAAGGY